MRGGANKAQGHGEVASPALIRSPRMAELSVERVIDDIYQAALVPEQWPAVLGQLSSATDGAGGLLFTSRIDSIQWTASSDIRGIFDEFLRDGWAAKNQRPSRLAALCQEGFIRDSDGIPLEEMDRDPVYTEFYRKRGLGWATGTMLEVPSGDSIIFSFERAFAKGPAPLEIVTFLDSFRPHLARAALLASRLGLERARTMAEALQVLGLPGAVLAPGGRVTAANAAFAELVPTVALDRRDRLHLTDAGADALLAQALARLSLPTVSSTVNSIPIAAGDGHPPLIVHVVPVRGLAQDIFARIAAMVVITPVDRGTVPGARVLQGLFDLTPAEARVAAAIAEGRTVEVIAAAANVSRETVRSQLKAVLGKAGVSRQVDLVQLLAGIAVPGRRTP
jgi:DNA-binding CsgD family transcriptional regulator